MITQKLVKFILQTANGLSHKHSPVQNCLNRLRLPQNKHFRYYFGAQRSIAVEGSFLEMLEQREILLLAGESTAFTMHIGGCVQPGLFLLQH